MVALDAVALDAASQPSAPERESLEARLERVTAERDALGAALAVARAGPATRAEADHLRNAFFAMASHELRTPLQSIALHMSVLLMRARQSADDVPKDWLVERLARTQDAVDRMRRLVDALLNLSELASGRLELSRADVDLEELATAAVVRARDALAWARCPCAVESDGPVRGHWDRLRLEIALDNLLTNAMKYAPGRPIVVGVGAEPGRGLLSVADEGPGIAVEDQARIFERFERAAGETRVPGFGLGLWIVRTLAAAHGGEVRLDSAPGRGATFTIALPLG